MAIFYFNRVSAKSGKILRRERVWSCSTLLGTKGALYDAIFSASHDSADSLSHFSPATSNLTECYSFSLEEIEKRSRVYILPAKAIRNRKAKNRRLAKMNDKERRRLIRKNKKHLTNRITVSV